MVSVAAIGDGWINTYPMNKARVVCTTRPTVLLLTAVESNFRVVSSGVISRQFLPSEVIPAANHSSHRARRCFHSHLTHLSDMMPVSKRVSRPLQESAVPPPPPTCRIRGVKMLQLALNSRVPRWSS